MRTALVALLLAAPLLVSCGGDDAPDVATDPGGPAASRPTAVPAAAGEVHSRGLATVMDDGDGPELCLGPVAESWPPQCGGPAVTGWDWAKHGRMSERQGAIRWGSFAVTGTWDGTSFAVTDAVPGALYDPMMVEPTAPPEPAATYSAAELEEMAGDLGDLPGAQGAYAEGGRVYVDVLYDDGSIQDWVDTTYGADVVVVTPALLDAR